MATQQSFGADEAPIPGFGDRLKARLKALRMSQAKLAELLGTSASSVNRIIREKEVPGAEKVGRLARILGTSVSYLYGDLPAEITPDDQVLLQRFAQWIERKRPKIDARKHPNVRIVALFSARDRRPPAARPTTLDKSRNVADAPVSSEFEIPQRFWDEGARAVARAEGDSMIDALIGDGDLLYVTEQTDFDAAVGKIIICRVGGRAYAKRLMQENKRLSLGSANTRYTSININKSEIEIIGIVIGRCGRTE
jgi:SOS-response transcriptional repressor LexA